MGLTGRILLADDNQAIRKLVCQLFDKHAFLEIRYEAADGQQAVEETKKHRPDLVILDLSMPVMDGLQAAKTIRKLFPNIPIILFTLYADVIQTSDTSGFTRIIPKAKMEVLVSQAEELVNFGQPRVVP
jgi:CheY-like chemotaxis protein